jgi:hypothetical protein
METQTLEVLAERVEGLERENRLLKRIGGGAILGFLALIAFGTNAFRAPREIAAERFVLKDDRGQPRARLEMRPEGPAFALLNREGKDQALLYACDTGTTTLDYFEGTELKSSLVNHSQLGPSLNLLDRNRRSKAELFVSPEGSLGLGLHRYQRGAGLSMEPDGTAKLSFQGPRGEERAGVALSPDGSTQSLGGTDFPSIGLGLPEADAVPDIPAPMVAPVPAPTPEPTDTNMTGGTLGTRTCVAP